jgi:AraC-like DNA-binding protein
MAASLADPELSIDRIAAAMASSKRYLHSAFEREGTTIQSHIWHLGIETCRRALADGTQAQVGILSTTCRREAVLKTARD